ncbi:DivIVA domain-containing protein [Agromyces sp. NPDC058126]|uniref:DivIVA domain-containing protein n=1 Tax=Agromyces sp. NPDC058126 TaxID=3346350 RepID=UPI0036D809F0
MTPDPDNELRSDTAPTPVTAPDPVPAVDLARAIARLPKTDPAKFSVRHIGAGYDRSEIDEFLAELNEAIDTVRAAAEHDRREIDALRAENARLSSTAEAKHDEEVTLGAVDLLSQAQTIADRAVADAEQYARDLVLAAREEYRDVLERAARAEEAHAGSGAAAPDAASHGSMPEIEYVRTYAKVAQVQLRSVLEALAEQVDRLGSLPQPRSAPASNPEDASDDHDGIDDEPDWLPAVPPEPAIQRQTYIKP